MKKSTQYEQTGKTVIIAIEENPYNASRKVIEAMKELGFTVVDVYRRKQIYIEF